MLETHLFEQVAEAVRSLVPDDLGPLQMRSHRRGVKAWFGTDPRSRQHFEAQVMPRRYVDGVEGVAVEIGFHAEHKDTEHNVRVINLLEQQQKTWRKRLGAEAEIGVFYGADNWRRVSEVWIEPDLDDPELAFELATRLVDYLTAIEPVLSADGPDA